MAWHDILWPEYYSAVHGSKTVTRNDKSYPVEIRGPVPGSINYLHMSVATSLLMDPTPERAQDYIDLLEEEERVGHLSQEGPQGRRTEAGSPGMHWSMNTAPVVGVTLRALQGWFDKFLSRELIDKIIRLGLRWISNELALDCSFRFKGKVILPCPRVKDEKKQKPYDGYRDVFVKLALGERVKKKAEYWSSPSSLAVSLMRDLMKLDPDIPPYYVRMPKLLLSINKKVLGDGGYLAWIDDTPEHRVILGKDGVSWIRCSNIDGITFGYDWEPLPS